MDYKKLHKDTINKLQQMVNSGKITVETARGICADFVPESEDERIRKALINDVTTSYERNRLFKDIPKEKFISWLKKQGEQKSADKVKPKFEIEEGKWYVCTQTYTLRGKIVVIKGQTYKSNQDGAIEGEDGHLFIDKIDGKALNYFKPWTIQDAKDGDVLACESGWTCIFKSLVDDETFSSYCFMDKTKWFCETGSCCHTLKEEFVKSYNGNIHPATKEQRDQLEKAMVDAGYRWNPYEKKMEKLEQKPAKEYSFNIESELFHQLTPAQQGLWKKEIEQAYNAGADTQKPTEWSKEDEKMMDIILNDINYAQKNFSDSKLISYDKKVEWLKNRLKSIRPQNRCGWNDMSVKPIYPCDILYQQPNGNMFIYRYIEGGRANDAQTPTFCNLDENGKWIYLKDIKPQNTWKPSEEQMKALWDSIPEDVKEISEREMLLNELYKDLKKL